MLVVEVVGSDLADRPLRVVVSDVFAERPVEMMPTEDERPVKAFTSDGADPSFGEGVRPRSADRGEDGLDAVRGEDRVEAPRVLGVSVPDQVAKPSPPWQVPREVAGSLRDPAGVGVRRHAGQMHTPRPELDDEGDECVGARWSPR